MLGRRDPESRHEARFELRGRRSGDGDMNEANDMTENWGSGVVARTPIAGVMVGVTEVEWFCIWLEEDVVASLCNADSRSALSMLGVWS